MKLNLNYLLVLTLSALTSCGFKAEVEPRTKMVPVDRSKTDAVLYTGGEQEHLSITNTERVKRIDCAGDPISVKNTFGKDTTVIVQGEPTTPRKVLGLSPDDSLFVKKAGAEKEVPPVPPAAKPVVEKPAPTTTKTEDSDDSLWPFIWKYVLPILVVIALAGMLYKFLTTPWGPSRRSEQPDNAVRESGGRRALPPLIIVERPAEPNSNKTVWYSRKEGDNEVSFEATGVNFPFQLTVSNGDGKPAKTFTFGPPPAEKEEPIPA